MALKKQSALPIVLVANVELLQTTIPAAKLLPYTPKSIRLFVTVAILITSMGTAASAGNVAESKSCMY